MENKVLEFNYVGFGQRVLSSLLDLVIFLPYLIICLIVEKYLSSAKLITLLLCNVFYYSLIVFLIVKYGGTPGKLIRKFKIVNSEGKNLSVIQAVMRNIINIIINVASLLITYSILKNTVFDSISTFLSLFVLIDVLVITMNYKKRAIHDYIAGSYVILDPAKIVQAPKISYKEEMERFDSALDRYTNKEPKD
jgi:uncharacterized RDD family membrane protein YckC